MNGIATFFLAMSLVCTGVAVLSKSPLLPPVVLLFTGICFGAVSLLLLIEKGIYRFR